MNILLSTRSNNKFRLYATQSLVILVMIMASFYGNTWAQAQPGAQNAETVPVNSLVIPMDNVNQGNASGTTFNLRAYGLANNLLQNNIPLKWAIKYNKGKDDIDLSAVVTRIAGPNGVANGTVNFSGGPFIVPPEFRTLAEPLITAFNNSISPDSNDVTVYRVTTATVTDIRYTITHKPLVAIGPDGGNFGTGVYQSLLTAALIPNYTSVTDASMQPTSCYTLAAQAHSVVTTWVSSYSGFVQNGGNLLLECASINTFENNVANGHYQTTNGYSVFGTNDNPRSDVSGTLIYPNGYMPFNQFVGALNGNQDGAVTDFSLASGSAYQNGTLIAARHDNGSGSNRTANVATVSKVGNVGREGGNVFALGGHDYDRGTATDLNNINGKRMILNTLFVPVTRPCSQLAQPQVEGYKSVRMKTDVAPVGLSQNDIVTWEVTYINRSLAPAVNFQITDAISNLMAYQAGSLVVTAAGASTNATANPLFNGVGNTNMLASGAQLAYNGRITVTFDAKMLLPAAVIENQTTGTGSNVPTLGIKSDSIDNNDPPVVYSGAGGNVTAPVGSFVQDPFQTNSTIDPTVINYIVPTAAGVTISGRVMTSQLMGVRNAVVILSDPEGNVRMTRTSAFGYYSFSDVEVGMSYVISVASKQSVYTPRVVLLEDAVDGLDFIAGP
ncbi:MAG TPA: carboxypeptidase-like regulatory domain-containing protein [Pyrinomonadaceae bacterium]|nr:carboxypeptidase-like regulatory domain-containing protein [Pyrinomonadaceae bacterium]